MTDDDKSLALRGVELAFIAAVQNVFTASWLHFDQQHFTQCLETLKRSRAAAETIIFKVL